MSKVPRKDLSLEEVLDLLDMRLAQAGGDLRKAFSMLTTFESEFINGEIEKCTDFRYYAENYHVIGSEEEGFKTLYPFWDSQEIFYEKIKTLQDKKLPAKVIVLKARQLGLSTVSEALIFHKTIFREGCNTLVVAQDPGQADYLFGMARTAYDSLPWWMRPEARYEAKGRYLVFDRKDPMERLTNPGLKSQIFVEAANKMTGVAVGRTVHAAHMSEISNWANDEVLAEQIFPTMNAPDELAIMESTARGRKNFWHTFWMAAWEGKVEWTPVFIEFFRVKKYSIPIPEGLQFVATKDEDVLRAKVLEKTSIRISDEQFYWRRKKMEEFSALQGNEFKFYQEYPSATWMEAFQGSGVCAFNRRKLQYILETRCCDPRWYGEIELEIKGEKKKEKVRVVELYYKDEKGNFTTRKENVMLPAQEEYGGRLYMWEPPQEGETYYIGVDVAHGVPGGDFSVAQVIKIGHRTEPDEQVAEWRGWINPGPFAHVCCALGYWYNGAQLSIECNDVGQATNAEVMRVIQYENLFRWKHYDKIKNFMTDYFGWFTNSKTRDLIIAKFREYMDENMIILRSEWLIDECLDFSSVEGSRFEGQATHDDRCFTPDTLVKTGRGLKRISDVWVGDAVLSHDGYWHGVETVGKRPVDEEICRLKVFGVPEPIRCTDEHPILSMVRRQSCPVKFEDAGWVSAVGLNKGDAVFIPVAPLLQSPPLTDMELYLLGWCLADGHASVRNNNVRITFGRDEKICAEVVQDVIEGLVAKHPTEWMAGVGKQGRRICQSIVNLNDHGKWICVSCTNRWLSQWVRHWVGDPNRKRIHEDILNGQNTLPFVVGFLEGDGSQKNTRGAMDVSQKNQEVLYGIRDILLRHGIWAGIFPKLNRCRQARMSIGVPWLNKLLSAFPGCLYRPVSRKFEHPIARWSGNGFWVTLQEVGREQYKGFVHNLAVHDSHSYVAGEIAVHNCMAMMIAIFCAHDSEWGTAAALAPRSKEEKTELWRRRDFNNTDFSPVHDAGKVMSVSPVGEAREVPRDFALHSELSVEDDAWRML